MIGDTIARRSVRHGCFSRLRRTLGPRLWDGGTRGRICTLDGQRELTVKRDSGCASVPIQCYHDAMIGFVSGVSSRHTSWHGFRNPCARVTFTMTLHQSASTISATHSEALMLPPKPVSLVTKIPSSALSYYWDTKAPTRAQLLRAERFFLKFPPSIVYSAVKFRTVKFTSAPEVAFLGRSNVGKSSLLNALMGAKVCHTSVNPGRTRSMNFFAVGGEDGTGNPGKVMILDMPGYGKGSREEWGKEVEKYLVGRKEYVGLSFVVQYMVY